MFDFEHRRQPLLSRPRFFRRLLRSTLLGLGLIMFSLILGVIGYHQLGHLTWTDAFLNASMILSGMGPVAELHSRAAKLFAGCYAIYSGIALISSAGVIFAPILHRVLHRFHLATDSRD